MPVSAYNPNTSTRVATRNADGDVVRYTYDVFGNKTTMTTYRNESLGPASGDVTTWRYDEASNCMTNKVYADGKGPKYDYTPDGRLSQRIWARGIVTDYAYDGWNNLTNTMYSDGTPTVTLFYDAMGRQTNAVDAAGVSSFAYDDYGSLTNETVVGAAGENTIVRHWDAYGRTAGYSLVGRAAPNAPQRQTTIGYDADDALGLVYYNYRHYNPLDGRWTSRDPVESSNQYAILRIVNHYDWLGLRVLTWDDFTPVGQIPGASHTAQIATSWKLLPGELNIRIIKYHGDDCKGALRVRTNKETAQRETYINSQCPCDECAEAEIAYSHATVRVEIIKDQTLLLRQ
jgi:RHS repeat-associated protein